MAETSLKKTYRVVQWATGNVGRVAIRHFIASPVFELVAVLVFDADKVGKDAGDLAGTSPIGLQSVDDVDVILNLEADCVMYAPIWLDVDAVCRLLSCGKNVVSTSGPFYRTAFTSSDFDRIEAACQEGRSSFHGAGIHPGFAGDLLPLTLARITSRIEQVHVYEVVDFATDPSKYIMLMGMGMDPEQFAGNPSLLGESLPYFAQSMTEIVEGLGETAERFTHEVDVAVTTKDVAYRGTKDSDMPGAEGMIKAGTVGAQHHRWTAWVDGIPLVVFHAMYTMGDDVVESTCRFGRTRYRVVINGDPATELVLQGLSDKSGEHVHPGYAWTAMDAVNTIPAVVDAAPGVLTDFDLGLLKPRGLRRGQ